jgi:hypothetical protein
MDKYEEGGLDALLDKRLSQASHRCAPVDEVMVNGTIPQLLFRLECQALSYMVSQGWWYT